jgi:hypothetical protein
MGCCIWGNTANYKLAQHLRMERESLFILRCCTLIYRNVVFLFTDGFVALLFTKSAVVLFTVYTSFFQFIETHTLFAHTGWPPAAGSIILNYWLSLLLLPSFFRTVGQEQTQIRRKGSNLELFGTKQTNSEPSCSYFGKIDHKLHT